MVKLNMERVDGKCFVRRLVNDSKIDEWVGHDDHYYTNQFAESMKVKKISHLHDLEDDISACANCMDDRFNELEEASRLLRKHSPLRGLELFAGT